MPLRSLIVATLTLCVTVAWSIPDPPGPATVHVARAETILVPQGISAPRVLYPEGRVAFDAIEHILDRAMLSLTGEEGTAAWQQFLAGADRVGIMIDAGKYPVQAATVEIVIDRLVGAGIPPSRITVFSGDERDLFNAGFNISRDPNGVQVLGAESEGYRGGVSRIVGEYCDAIINLATLRVDPDLGMAGCVANALNCVPNVERVALRQTPELVPKVAAHPAVRAKTKLNILEAYLPLLEMNGAVKTTWQYRGLLVGTDTVAVDVVGRRILQACRNAYKQADWPLPLAPDYLRAAEQSYRVGQSDEALITVHLSGDETDNYLK